MQRNWCVQKPLVGDTVIIFADQKESQCYRAQNELGVWPEMLGLMRLQEEFTSLTQGTVMNLPLDDTGHLQPAQPALEWMVNVPCESVILVLSAGPNEFMNLVLSDQLLEGHAEFPGNENYWYPVTIVIDKAAFIAKLMLLPCFKFIDYKGKVGLVPADSWSLLSTGRGTH